MQLKFKLVYKNVTVQHISHYAMGTSLIPLKKVVDRDGWSESAKGICDVGML